MKLDPVGQVPVFVRPPLFFSQCEHSLYNFASLIIQFPPLTQLIEQRQQVLQLPLALAPIYQR